MNEQGVHALIPAAGQSVRFGGTTLKQYAHLLGQPVIAHSIEAVRKHPFVTGVTVALAPDDGIYDELIRPEYPEVTTVTGGASRAQTVMNGLLFIQENFPDPDWVLVHDAARPCLSASALHDLLGSGLASASGAILAVPVSDTLKRADSSGFIEHTVDRSALWSAQTPQLFRICQLAAHLEHALSRGEDPTDEAATMEAAGIRPLLIPGASTNIKITGAEDLALAEFILRHQSVTG
jgi:2-C-methyl-D-erythritol 4-phosphate cytidylyltransferase